MSGGGLVVDLFAGGGGASVGIEAALGRSVDIAINHDAVALAVHNGATATTAAVPGHLAVGHLREHGGARPATASARARPRACPGLDKPLGTVVAGGAKHALIEAFIAKHYGGVVGQGVQLPLGTITATDHHSLAAATLLKLRGECHGADVAEPTPTVTAAGTHVAEVRAFLTAYYGDDHAEGRGQAVIEPMRTLTAKARLGLVTVEGTEYQIVDIGMRMLEPHELLRAQFGRFAETYDLTAARTKSAKVRLIGNSVCPDVAAAVVGANAPGESREAVA